MTMNARNKEAAVRGVCPVCGCKVPEPTPAQEAWAVHHPILCAPCLKARTIRRTLAKALAKRKRRAAASSDGAARMV